MVKNLTKTTIEIIADNESLQLSRLAALVKCSPQNFYDIRSGKTKSVSASIADKILTVFPKYSRSWLMTGEGEMFNPSTKESPPGQSEVERLLSLIESYREDIRKKDEQIDRLITLLEKETQRSEFINKGAV